VELSYHNSRHAPVCVTPFKAMLHLDCHDLTSFNTRRLQQLLLSLYFYEISREEFLGEKHQGGSNNP
jgi:hypothetical protein